MNSKTEVLSKSSYIMPPRPQRSSTSASNRSKRRSANNDDDNVTGSGGGGGGRCKSTISAGCQTTRGFSKSLHGNYEGDFSMFATCFRLKRMRNGSLFVETTPDLKNIDDQRDGRNDGNERDKIFKAKTEEYEKFEMLATTTAAANTPKLKSQPTLMQQCWQNGKEKLFNEAQLKRISDAIDAVQRNVTLAMIISFLKFLMVMAIYFVFLSLSYASMGFVNMIWSASYMGSKLREVLRRLLWFNVLAPCDDDLKFFGLTLLLAPLVFLMSMAGFALVAYDAIKQFIRSGTSHMPPPPPTDFGTQRNGNSE